MWPTPFPSFDFKKLYYYLFIFRTTRAHRISSIPHSQSSSLIQCGTAQKIQPMRGSQLYSVRQPMGTRETLSGPRRPIRSKVQDVSTHQGPIGNKKNGYWCAGANRCRPSRFSDWTARYCSLKRLPGDAVTQGLCLVPGIRSHVIEDLVVWKGLSWELGELWEPIGIRGTVPWEAAGKTTFGIWSPKPYTQLEVHFWPFWNFQKAIIVFYIHTCGKYHWWGLRWVLHRALTIKLFLNHFDLGGNMFILNDLIIPHHNPRSAGNGLSFETKLRNPFDRGHRISAAITW